MTQSQDILFRLLRSALGTSAESIPSDFTDWEALIDLSFECGVASISVDGYNAMFSNQPPVNSGIQGCLLETKAFKGLKLDWFGSVLQGEDEYRRQKKVIADLAELYRQNGIRMMLLKGYGLSLNYPVPEHRNLGDVDIYLFGQWKEADALIGKQGIKVDNSHHHHSAFCYKGQIVENHFDFVNIYSHFSGRMVEKMLKALASVPGKEIMPNVYLPQPDLAALYTARHAACHFASGELVLRQILDWALLIRSTTHDIDWPAFWKDTEQMGMLPFVLVMVQIAVKYLGMDIAVFHLPQGLTPDENLARKVLSDTLCKEFSEAAPKGVVAYWRWMLRRWWSSRWKHRLVYSDSLISTILAQLISHLMRPESLRKK